ncbi:hypothetical protein V7128_01765 [Neobacillus vireti]|uniref:hypothetical protein n=1 Tax=Neobacillus vireti TaxID=220686 RepID=UPI002FFEA151
MQEKEFYIKLAQSFAVNPDVFELRAFFAYLKGYLDSEKEGEFEKLMRKAVRSTAFEKILEDIE